MTERLDSTAVAAAIDRLTAGVAAIEGESLILVGIRTRGETLAVRLRAQLGGVQGGAVDITMYRDDLSEIGPRPVVRPTRIDVPIDGATVVLVDDVLYTGRSVRAALSELADLGRPAAVRLAVLVDRGGRELPIQPDVCGLTLATDRHVRVRLSEVDGYDAIEVADG